MPRKRIIKYRDGPREDLGNTNFRSSWEANIARLLNHLEIRWKFEPKRFYFNSCLDSYLPDFFLMDKNPWDTDWIEIKGLWHKGDKRKIILFNREYPKESLHVIARKEYMELKKKYSKIVPFWEK